MFLFNERMIKHFRTSPIIFVTNFHTAFKTISGSIPPTTDLIVNEPPHGKTNNLHMRKQRRRSASQLPRSNWEADQRLCFRYTESTIPLL